MPYTSKQVLVLQAERTIDPHARSYSGMDDAQFLASVTLQDIPRPRDINTRDIFNEIVGADLPGVGTAERADLELVMMSNAGQQFTIEGNVLLALQSIFGVATPTRANLITLSTIDKSPAELLSLPVPTLSDISRTT